MEIIRDEKFQKFKIGRQHQYTLYWLDKVYASPCLEYFSTEKWTPEFEKFSERFNRQFYEPYGYVLN